MCEQTMLYPVGTLLWFKTPNKIWWPAKVIDASTMPEDLHNYRETMKDKTLAVVKFMTENKYELVTNVEKVCLYSSPKKMDFIEKGYSKYLEQKKGIKCEFNMEYFIEDVKYFEKEIEGDEDIFVKVEKNITHQKKNSTEYNQLVSTLFKTSKPTKKKMSKTAKPKLKNTNISKSHSYCTPVTKQTQSTHSQTNTTRKKIENSPNYATDASNKNLANSIENNTRNALPVPRMKSPNLLQEPKGTYVCLIEGCNYSALNFNLLKQHLGCHEDKCREIDESKESVNLNEKNHIKTENVESCIKPSTSTETKFSPCPSRVKTKNLIVRNNEKANRLVNNITDGEECMFGKTIPTDEWVKHNPWVAFKDNGMDEARKYASMIMNMSTVSLEPHDLKPMLEEEPPFKAPIFCGAPYDENPANFEIFQAPVVPPKYTDEELVQLPEFKMIRELIDSGQEDALTVTVMGAKRIQNPFDAFH